MQVLLSYRSYTVSAVNWTLCLCVYVRTSRVCDGLSDNIETLFYSSSVIAVIGKLGHHAV